MNVYAKWISKARLASEWYTTDQLGGLDFFSEIVSSSGAGWEGLRLCATSGSGVVFLFWAVAKEWDGPIAGAISVVGRER